MREATRSFGSRDNTQPLLSPPATGMDLFHHTRSHKGGPQQHTAHGLLQRHNVPCKCILPRTLAVLEDFTRHDYRLPKRSAQPQGPHYPMGTPSPAPGARGTLTAAPAQSPAGRRKEETATRARSKGPISPSPNTRATRRLRRAEAPPEKGSSEPSRKAGRTGVQVPAHWAASQGSLSCHCSGQGTHCGREEHEQHARRWESQPSRRSWLLYCPKEPPNAKHLAWWHLQTC